MSRANRTFGLLLVAISSLLLAGCIPNHQVQPKYNTYEASPFFYDNASARPFVENTVSREQGRRDDPVYTGTEGGQPVDQIPIEVNDALRDRGRQRYDIFCAPCHGAEGQGDGRVVQRGYKQPASLTDQRLVDSPDGYLYSVISNGFGQMPPYNIQIPVNDRWAIVAYLRQMQEGN